MTPSSLTAARARRGTYSIVARDPVSGELGVAVQSHWFSVGPIVPWARAGVGAVATQANVEVSYGPRALDLLQSGVGAEAALARLVAEDEGSAGRQVAVVDASGAVGSHTGESCMPSAGHVTGESASCQANIMTSDRVWPAMLAAFEAAQGSLTMRLLAALDAAESEGGDLRGRQSAALLVVPAQGAPWDSVVSLRVEDHPDPLTELRRLVDLHDVYTIAGEADELVNQGLYDKAAHLYLRAYKRAPENPELRFWAGIGAAQLGDVEAGVRQVEGAIRMSPGWGELLQRLPPEVAPAASVIRAAIEASRRAR
jgi:uncharacterized Ntn-hydrolase superfamily protein